MIRVEDKDFLVDENSGQPFTVAAVLFLLWFFRLLLFFLFLPFSTNFRSLLKKWKGETDEPKFLFELFNFFSPPPPPPPEVGFVSSFYTKFHSQGPIRIVVSSAPVWVAVFPFAQLFLENAGSTWEPRRVPPLCWDFCGIPTKVLKSQGLLAILTFKNTHQSCRGG